MPEFWIPYGSVEVAVEVKAENLQGIVEAHYPSLPQERLEESIEGLKGWGMKDLLLIVPRLHSPLSKLLKLLGEKGAAGRGCLRIAAPASEAPSLKRLLEGGVQLLPIERLKGKGGSSTLSSLLQRPEGFEGALLLGRTSFDPIFGYRNGPLELLEELGFYHYHHLLLRDLPRSPRPGRVSQELLELVKELDELRWLHCLEVIGYDDRVSFVKLGGSGEACGEGFRRLQQLARKEIDEAARGVVAGAGKAGSTLAEALAALWNVVPGVREKGVIVLMAECQEGLGSEALRAYLMGQLSPEEALARGLQIRGLLDLILLKEVLKRYTLILVSTLPKYYTQVKLGFLTPSTASEAVEHALSLLGSKSKLLLVPQADGIALSLGKA